MSVCRRSGEACAVCPVLCATFVGAARLAWAFVEGSLDTPPCTEGAACLLDHLVLKPLLDARDDGQASIGSCREPEQQPVVVATNWD